MIEKISSLLLIQSGERRRLLYFISLFFLLGCGMAIGRGSADALFFKRYGIQHLPLVYLIQGGLLFLVTIGYASYTDRIAPERLLKPLTVIFSTVLLGLWFVMNYSTSELIYPVYYLFYEMVSEIYIVHCILYVAQNFNVMQSKRLTPIIWGGWQLGAVIGGIILATMVAEHDLQTMLLVWVSILIVAAILVEYYHKKVGISPYHRSGKKGKYPLRQAFEQLSQGVSFASKSPLLKAMSMAMFFMVITFYVLCYSVHRVYTAEFKTESELTVFYGILAATTGVIALSIQIFMTNRLIRRYGVRKMNLVFPLMTLTGFGALLISFTLPAAIFASVIKDAIMPAVRNPVRSLFFNALPSFMQGRSHAISIGLVLPLALVAAGLTLMLAQQIKDVLYFLGLGVVTACVYFLYNIQMNDGYLNSLIGSLKQKLFVPNEDIKNTIRGDEEQALAVLEQASKDQEADIRFTAARTMLDLFPDRAGPIVLSVLSSLQPPLKDQLFKLLAPLQPPHLRDYLWQELDNEDDHLRATVMFVLFKIRDAEAKSLVGKAMLDSNPRVRAMGIYGALTYPVPECTEAAINTWKGLFQNKEKTELLAALDLLKKWPNVEFADKLPELLCSNDFRIQHFALQVVAQWPNNNIKGLTSIITAQLDSQDSAVRVSAASCIKLLNDHERHQLALSAIESDHPSVRQYAAAAMFPEATKNDEIVRWLIENHASPRAQSAVMNLLLARKPTRQSWEAIARAKAELAAQFLEAHKLLSDPANKRNLQDDPVVVVLLLVLQERCRNFLDQALIAAKQYEDDTTVGVIRAGLLCEDTRYFSAASEAVGYIKDQSLAKLLISVLTKLAGESVKRKTDGLPFSDLTSLLQWLRGKDDPWIQQCMQQLKA